MQFLYAIRSRGITDSRVLNAMEKIDRRKFLKGVFEEKAYQDIPLPIACGQTISQPSIVAQMTQSLNVTPRCKVLEIGTGSGYQAAILSRLARRVYTLERHLELIIQAQNVFDNLNLSNITAMRSDGSRGLPAQAPFDRILLTAAAEDPPAPLLEQLKVNGIMVLPVGQSDSVQTMIKITKTEKGLSYHEMGEVRFVPLIEGIAEV
ncbi:MAG: protein-L-isoaspartate(D-aspartate) O-methyltransferase [Paracoccaceae bacterium]|nr:protein-L-isoaspartate(D-aspartate) O-methyltransferase [Paracoccaceae bacterium]MDE2693523.1 protein-L-isoaspartate(D-aspartate) O-methyltransferase [Paracoccaceae bacterium]